jgi:hypothetical protein
MLPGRLLMLLWGKEIIKTMPIKEFRKKILETQNPEWFNKKAFSFSNFVNSETLEIVT